MQSLDTGANACSVEWCPAPDCSNFVACGLYELQEELQAGSKEQVRAGEVLLYDLHQEHPERPLLRRVLTAPCAGGVLDCKWATRAGKPVLACATSAGILQLLGLDTEGDEVRLGALCDGPRQPKGLLLSLDWSGNDMIATSDSAGSLALWRLTESGIIEQEARWKAHTLAGRDTEVWISFFSPRDRNLLLSGADDALLKAWDARTSRSAPVFTQRGHEMGVTSGQWHPHLEHCFATGSYDKHVRIWDVRSVKRPVVECNVGGGVWRLKWHPKAERAGIILAACMHAGVKVLRISSIEQESGAPEEPNVLAHFSGHESMAYGADWCRQEGSLLSEAAPLVASCSFYDRNLSLWASKWASEED